ncbi:FAD-binding oxidoreductase [Thalassoglobus polymorphus]|nr:FAD-binding oxidoreductase [Thalassoglobus polymorphus]
MPTTEWTPTTVSELSRIVSENFQEQKSSFMPVGGRTSLHSAGQVSGETVLLETGELNQIIEYPSRDMTITVEAGIRFETLQKELAKEKQRLPIDIPQASRASLGGAIASNTSGPSRFGYGTFRDYVIGISAVDGQGRLFSAGGKVVKNVAGYDLGKLLIGSMGTLATITEVTLKLRPIFETRVIVIASFEPEFDLDAVLVAMDKSATRPCVLDLLNTKAAWQLDGEANLKLPDGKTLLWIEYEGTAAETNWQATTVLEELKQYRPEDVVTIEDDSHEQFHDALREFQTASDDPITFRASLPKSRCAEFLKLATEANVAAQAHAGNGVVYGHLPDRCTTPQVANEILLSLRNFAESHQGALTVLSFDGEWADKIDLYGRRNSAWGLMSRVKETLDPEKLMSPNRFIT